MKKVNVLFVMMLLLTFLLSSFAEEGPEYTIEDRFTEIASISASCNVLSGQASAQSALVPHLRRRTYLCVSLERSATGYDGWATIQPWTGSNNHGSCGAGGTFSVSSGYYYRTYAEGYVYDDDDNLLEHANCVSLVRYY